MRLSPRTGTTAAPGAARPARLRGRGPRSLGPRRLMYGSDWPVRTLAGDCSGVLTTAQGLTAVLSEPERAEIFEGTATRRPRTVSR